MNRRPAAVAPGPTERAATFSGLVVALFAPALYSLAIGPALLRSRLDPTGYAVAGQAVLWALTLSLLAIVRFGERRPPESIEVRGLSWRRLGLAVGLGLALSLLVPLLGSIMDRILPAGGVGDVTDVAGRYPPWLLLLGVLTAGITEEVLFRAYAIERLLELTGSRWLAGGISLAAFVLVHLAGWNLAHVVGVVLPLGAALTAVYLWKRDLMVVVVAHVIIDLPLFFMALGRPSG